jgi:hypothetical protein
LNQLDFNVFNSNEKQFPAISALGYVLTALYTFEPWKLEIDEDLLAGIGVSLPDYTGGYDF